MRVYQKGAAGYFTHYLLKQRRCRVEQYHADGDKDGKEAPDHTDTLAVFWVEHKM